jgi:hypothetical protein
MQVEDLDGNVLRLGSEPKSDQAVGEWLDMVAIGGPWLQMAHGLGWRRPERDIANLKPRGQRRRGMLPTLLKSVSFK